LFEGEVVEVGEGSGDVEDVGGFVGALLADGLGREERGVGFDHNAVEGGAFGGVADFGGVVVGEDAGEGDEGAEVEEEVDFAGAGGEAVEDEAVGWEVGIAEDGDEVVEGVAAVEDDWFAAVGGVGGVGVALGFGSVGVGGDHVELLIEDAPLDVVGWVVVVVVEAEFAEGDAARVVARVVGGLGDDVPVVFGGAVGSVAVEGVDAGGAPDVRMVCGECERVRGVLCVCGDGEGAGDAAGGGAFEDEVDAVSVVGEGEMAVGVDHGDTVASAFVGTGREWT